MLLPASQKAFPAILLFGQFTEYIYIKVVMRSAMCPICVRYLVRAISILFIIFLFFWQKDLLDKL